MLADEKAKASGARLGESRAIINEMDKSFFVLSALRYFFRASIWFY
jgi:hypothetical protein